MEHNAERLSSTVSTYVYMFIYECMLSRQFCFSLYTHRPSIARGMLCGDRFNQALYSRSASLFLFCSSLLFLSLFLSAQATAAIAKLSTKRTRPHKRALIGKKMENHHVPSSTFCFIFVLLYANDASWMDSGLKKNETRIKRKRSSICQFQRFPAFASLRTWKCVQIYRDHFNADFANQTEEWTLNYDRLYFILSLNYRNLDLGRKAIWGNAIQKLKKAWLQYSCWILYTHNVYIYMSSALGRSRITVHSVNWTRL